MKTLTTVVLLAMLAISAAHAENFTQTNTDKARAIIEAAVEAHGGDALLDGLQTLVIRHETENYSVDQSRGTKPPWDKSQSSGVDAIDLDGSVFVTRQTNDGGGFVGENSTIINAEDSLQIDHRAGTVARIAEPDFATSSGPFVRVTPALLVRVLQERAANAHFLGETEFDGVAYNVVGFSMTVGPAISLYFDKKTNLLHRSERVFPGFGLVEYAFTKYKTFDGVPFNRKFELFLNGDLNLERKIVSVDINKPLAELLVADSKLVEIPELAPDTFSRQEIADDVWLIGGNNTYAMFVDMGDYIFAAGGTGGSAERIDSLREAVGDKPIKYAMMTHHHFDHVAAVGDYESEGATLITASAHERIIRRAAENGEALNVKTVDGRLVLGDGDRKIEIIDIGPTEHTEHLLLAFLPHAGIVFEADHFSLPRVGPVPPAVPATQNFAAALARLELDVKRIASAHSSRVATMDDLRIALSTDAFQARQ